jgi:hypothetical protein
MNIFFRIPWEERNVLKHRWFGAVLLLAGMVVHAQGQQDKDTVTITWKFEKGKPFFQQMTTKTKQTMKVMGMDITQNQSQTFTFSWTPKEEKDKNWIVVQKIEAVQMDIEIGGNPIKYDSTKDAPGTGNPLAEFFKNLVGSEFTLTISPEMKVIKIEGREEFIQKLTKVNPQMEALLKQILGDEALKQMADPAFASVPTKPVKKGESWPGTSKLNMGPIGSYDTTYKYTYEGKDGKLEKIKVDATLKYEPPAASASGSLPFKIKSADLKSKDATGTIWFDNEKHYLDHSSMKMKLEGKLTIDISGMTTDVDLTQEQDTDVKTFDTNPIKK